MRRKGPFIRDVELHGHHKQCMADYDGPCLCRELDYDDWIAAGEREMDHRRENPRERTVSDDE